MTTTGLPGRFGI